MKKSFRAVIIGIMTGLSIFAPVRKAQAAAPLIWLAANLLGPPIIEAGLKHVFHAPAVQYPVAVIPPKTADYGKSTLVTPKVSAWKTDTGGLFTKLYNKLGLPAAFQSQVGRYAMFGISLATIGASALANSNLAPTLAAKGTSRQGTNPEFPGWVQMQMPGDIFGTYGTQTFQVDAPGFVAVSPEVYTSNNLGTNTSICLSKNDYVNQYCWGGGVTYNTPTGQGAVPLYHSISNTPNNTQKLAGYMYAHGVPSAPSTNDPPPPVIDWQGLYGDIGSSSTAAKTAYSNEIDALLSNKKIATTEYDIRQTANADAYPSSPATEWESAQALHSVGDAGFDGTNGSIKAQAADKVNADLAAAHGAVADRLSALDARNRQIQQYETITAQNQAELSANATEATILKSMLDSVNKVAEKEFGISTSSLNPDGSTSSSTGTNTGTGQQTQETPYTPTPLAGPYTLPEVDFGARTQLFFDRLRGSGLFSLPGQVFQGITNNCAGDPILEFSGGETFGMQRFDFSTLSTVFITMKAIFLTVFAWIAARIITMKR